MKASSNLSLLRMLAMVLCIASAAQMQAITIKVQKGGAAPYLYAWTGTAPNDTKLTGNWPGTQFTDKDADGYWTMNIETQLNAINMKLNMGSSANETNDYLNITGVNGVIKLLYDGTNTMFGTMPQYTYQAGKLAYFVCPPTWDGNNLYCKIRHNDYEEAHKMTKIGTDGMGLDIYVDLEFTNWNDTPQQVQFYDLSNHNTANLTYKLGGYYNTEKDVAVFEELTAANGYTDPNFRTAITDFTGMSGAFCPNSITYLDVSNHGITNLAGINKFNNLQTLIAANNALTTANVNLSNNTTLEVLNLSGNNSITKVDVAALTGLQYLDISSCNIDDNQTFSPAGSHTALTYLDMSNNPTSKGFSWHQFLPNLETLKLANANIKPTGFTQGTNYFSDMNNLKYLDVSNCPLVTSIYLTGAPNLETLILNKNTALQSATATSSGKLIGLNSLAKLKHVEFTDVDLATATFIGNLAASKGTLEYLDLSRATLAAPSLSDFTALKTFKAAGNYNLQSGSSRYSLTTLTINNSPELSSIDLTGDHGLVTLNLTNIGRNNNNIDGLFTGLTDCSALEMMNFDGNGFTSVPAFGHRTYTSLKLNKNALTSIDMSGADPGVQFLYAEENGLGGNVELTAASTASLKGLDLGNNGITSFKAENTGLSALMIGDNPDMTTLELHGNDNLTCTTADTIMSDSSGLYLKGNTNLEWINIENSKFNNIGANGSLNGLSKVKTLRASHNEFKTFTNSNYSHKDSRAHTLSNLVGKPSLEDLTGLEYLDLSYNLIKDSVHLYRNTELKRLDVSHNQILRPLPTTDAERTAMIDKKLKAALKYGKTYNGGTVGKSVELTDAIRTALTKEDPYRHETRYADYRPCDLRDTTGIFHLDLTYNTKLEYIDISYTNIHNTAANRGYMNPGWETNDGDDSWDSWVSDPVPNQNYGTVKHHFIWMQPAGDNLKVFKADHNNMQSLGTANNLQIDTLSARYMYGDCLFMATPPGTVNDYIGYGSKGFNYPNCARARYIDFSYGSFYSFDPTNLTNVEKLILTGNPIGGGKYPNYVLDVTHNSKLQQLQADTCTDLQTIEAHDLNDLAILDVTGNTALKTLRAYNDPVLYNAQTDFITGLSGCANLEELWVSNDNLPELEVWNNKKLSTLKCYDNAILPSLDLTENTLLSHLDFHNCKLNVIDLSKNTALTYIDCSSLAVATSINENGKNKLSDLDIYSDGIQTVIANCNNLYRMTGLNKASLTRLEFEHNHINGIDLSKTGLTDATLKDTDNGRTIDADYSIASTMGTNNSPVYYDLYFFQVDSLAASNGGVFLGDKYSSDVLKNETRDKLNAEGLVSTKITAWTKNAVGPIAAGQKSNNYVDPSNVNTLINPANVIGSIVVLDEQNKHSEYTYNTGVSGHTSTYYLDWNAPSVPTAVTDINTDTPAPVVSGGYGTISVTAPDGTAIMVYDMAGRLVQQTTAGGGEVVIDGISPGAYIVNGQKVIVK